MTERWLYAWGLGSVAFGGASLLVPLYIVQLGATPVQLGLLAATAALIGAPGAILFGRLANRVEHRRTLVLVTLAAEWTEVPWDGPVHFDRLRRVRVRRPLRIGADLDARPVQV